MARFLLPLCIFFFANIGWGDPRTVAFFEVPPHSFENGTGAAIDFFKEATRDMGVEFQFQVIPLPRILAMEEVQYVLFMAKTKEREAAFWFSREPITAIQGVLVVPERSLIQKISQFSDLKGLNVYLWSAGYRTPQLGEGGALIHEEAGQALDERLLQRVAAGRIDAFYCPDRLAVERELKKLKLSEKVRVMPLPEKPLNLYFAVRKSAPDARGQMKKIEKAFGRLKKVKSYDQFLSSFL